MTDIAFWEGWDLMLLPQVRATDGEGVRAQARQRQRYHDQLAALHLLAEFAPDVAEGRKDISVTDDIVTALFDQLAAVASGLALRQQHNFLVRGLEKGTRELNWKLNIPSPMVIVPAHAPAVRSATIEHLITWDRWIDSHVSRSAPSPASDAEYAKWSAGCLLFSLIHDGSVLSRKWLEAIPDAVTEGVGWAEGQLYLTLKRRAPKSGRPTAAKRPEASAPAASSSGAEPSPQASTASETPSGYLYRRVFLSPLTSLLLRVHYSQQGTSWPEDTAIEQCLRSYCKTLTGEKLPSKLLTFVLEAGSTAAALDLQPLFVRYAQKRDWAPSLPPSCWHRLLTGEVQDISAVDPEDRNEDRLAYRPFATATCMNYPDQLRQLRHLQGQISQMKGSKRPTNSIICQRLEAFLSPEQGNGPMVVVLGEWVRHLMVYGGRVKSRLKPRSVANYLSTIATPLVIHSHDYYDLSLLTADDWQGLYDRVLSDATGDEVRSLRAQRLRVFHDFLMDHHGVPDVELEAGSGVAKRVDVNLLTVAEYCRAKQLIRESPQPARLREMQELALVIGYRCGLRRSECASLLVRDIAFDTTATGTTAELIVRPNRFHTGKSESATRRLPLRILLTLDEWRQLKKWVAIRNGEGITTNANRELLFCEQGVGLQPLTDAVLFRPIQSVMKLASGDPSLRFHHLRHSFVNFTLLRLLEESPGELLPEAWARNDQGDIAMPHWGEDISAMAWLAPREETTRKRVWLLSLWAGHAGPHETLASYTHLLDWVASQSIRKHQDPILPTIVQAALLEQSTGSIAVWRSRHKLKGKTRASHLFDILKTKHTFKKLPLAVAPSTAAWHAYVPPNDARIGQIGPSSDTQTLDPMVIYQCLRLFGQLETTGETQTLCIARTADRFGVTQPQLTHWIREGERLMSLKTRQGTSRFSRCRDIDKRQQLAISPSCYLPELPRCIAPPKSQKAQRAARTYFHALLDWHHHEPSACLQSLATYRDVMQRTTGQLTFSSDNARQAALRLLRMLHLEQHVQVVIELAPHAPREKIVTYWRKHTQLTQRQIRVVDSTERLQSSHDWYHKADIRLSDSKSDGHNQPLELLPALRFAIFMVLMVIGTEKADPQEDLSHPPATPDALSADE